MPKMFLPRAGLALALFSSVCLLGLQNGCAPPSDLGTFVVVAADQTVTDSVAEPIVDVDRIEAALDRRIAWDFQDCPLKELIQRLEEQLGVGFELNFSKLDEVGATGNELVNIHAENVSLRTGLTLLLREQELTFCSRDGVLVITTPEDAESRLDTRFYAVSDLVRGPNPESMERRRQALLTSITTIFAPQSWDLLGGPASAETLRGTMLTISQTRDVQRDVPLFLALLRTARADFAAEPTRVQKLYYPISRTAVIEEALQRPDTRRFEEPLATLVGQWSAASGVYFHLDVKRLAEVGIGPDVVVSGDFRDTPLQLELRRTLRPLELSWLLLEDAVLITTPEQAESRLDQRLYPVYDLVSAAEGHVGQRWMLRAFDEIADVLTTTVAGHSWDNVGGPGAISFWEFPPALLISQTHDVHRQIGDRLTELREYEAAAKALGGPSETAAHPLERRVFPLRRVLTAAVPLHAPAPTDVERSAVAVDGDPAKASNVQIWDRPDWKNVLPVEANIVIPAIRKMIAPESWDEPGVAIEAIHDRLIVRHRRQVLDEVEDFLDELDLWHPHTSS